jgi:hypothetical protein
VSEHTRDSPCAGCLHPEDDPGPADDIPTISFVSAMSGFLLGYRLVRATTAGPHPSQTLAYPFNLAGSDHSGMVRLRRAPTVPFAARQAEPHPSRPDEIQANHEVRSRCLTSSTPVALDRELRIAAADLSPRPVPKTGDRSIVPNAPLSEAADLQANRSPAGRRSRAPRLVFPMAMRFVGPSVPRPSRTLSDPVEPRTCPQDLSPGCCLSGTQQMTLTLTRRTRGSAGISCRWTVAVRPANRLCAVGWAAASTYRFGRDAGGPCVRTATRRRDCGHGSPDQ